MPAKAPSSQPVPHGCPRSTVGAGLPAKAPSQSTSLSRLYPTYCRSRLAGEGGLPINHSLAAVPDLLWGLPTMAA
jgi:hypothetical protein